MDKFGVFNLINSLVSHYKNNAGNFSTPKSAEVGTGNPPLKPSPTEQKGFLPLQEGMLNTIKNHDQIVKRVILENKNKKQEN